MQPRRRTHILSTHILLVPDLSVVAHQQGQSCRGTPDNLTPAQGRCGPLRAVGSQQDDRRAFAGGCACSERGDRHKNSSATRPNLNQIDIRTEVARAVVNGGLSRSVAAVRMSLELFLLPRKISRRPRAETSGGWETQPRPPRSGRQWVLAGTFQPSAGDRSYSSPIAGSCSAVRDLQRCTRRSPALAV